MLHAATEIVNDKGNIKQKNQDILHDYIDICGILTGIIKFDKIFMPR